MRKRLPATSYVGLPVPAVTPPAGLPPLPGKRGRVPCTRCGADFELPVPAFGGEGLRDHAVALVVAGVTVAYCSVCTATPLPEDWTAHSYKDRVWAIRGGDESEPDVHMVTMFRPDLKVDAQVSDVPLADLLAVLAHLKARAERGEA